LSNFTLNSAHIPTFPLPYPSRQTFSFSSALRPVLLPFPLLRRHFPPHPRLVLSFFLTCLSSLFSPCPPPCLLIFPPLSTCLLTLFFPMHFLSFPSLFHSPVPLFFLSHHHFSALLRSSPYAFSPFSIHLFILFSFILIHRFFFFPHLPRFLFPFRPCIRLAFSVPLPRLSFSFHTSLSRLSLPLFLLYSLSPRFSLPLLFHTHRPFFRASRCPTLRKTILSLSSRSFLHGTKKRKAAASRFLIATIC